MEKFTPPQYDELSSAWWAIHDCFLHYEHEAWRNHMINKVFCELLQQCGWTVDQWNNETTAKSKSLK